MNGLDFTEGYNSYIQGYPFQPHASQAWRRGWYAAERDAYSYWYSMSAKEIEMMGDKWQEGNEYGD